MKKVLCYIALVLLVMIIILPPVLRVFNNEKASDNSGIDNSDVIQLLSCDKDSEKVSSSYLNNAITSLKYSYTTSDAADFISSLKDFMTSNNIEASVSSNEYTYIATFSNNVYTAGVLSYNQNINTQKSYYESLGYTCVILNS